MYEVILSTKPSVERCGATSIGFFVAALFFLKFWRTTRLGTAIHTNYQAAWSGWITIRATDGTELSVEEMLSWR